MMMTHPAGEDDVVSAASRKQIVHLMTSIESSTKTVRIIAIFRTDQIQFSFGLICSIKSPTMLV